MDTIPDSLRYTDGNYVPERMPWLAGEQTIRNRRIFSRTLHAVHKPWFIVRLPRGVGVLTTIGRKSGKARRTYIKAVRDGDKAYLVSIPGEQALWLKNIQANSTIELRLTDGTYTGTAREPHDEAELRTAHDAFCGTVHPFDYIENAFHRKGRPSRTKIVELHSAWFEGGTPLVVDLESAQSRVPSILRAGRTRSAGRAEPT